MESIFKPVRVQSNKFVIPNPNNNPDWNLYEKLMKLLGEFIKSSLPNTPGPCEASTEMGYKCTCVCIVIDSYAIPY